jgi:hypothetical protein
MSSYKKVRQLTLQGDLIKVFDSMKSASVILDVNYYSISKCCNFTYDQTKGYRFEFETD